MSNDEQTTIKVIDHSIQELCVFFEQQPSMFYTESDIVCELVSRIQSALEYKTASDVEKKPHSLVHTEYPTPFKCDMANKSFVVAYENSCSKRGHYDIVVMSREFIEAFPYSIIKGQDFRMIKQALANYKSHTAILYGIEIIFRRDEVKSLDGIEKEIRQDNDKLMASRIDGFMANSKTLVFIYRTPTDRCKKLCLRFKKEIERGEINITCIDDNMSLKFTDPSDVLDRFVSSSPRLE